MKMKSFGAITLSLLIGGIFGACSHTPSLPVIADKTASTSATEEEASNAITNQAAAVANASYYVEVKFKLGEVELSEASKNQISDLMSRAKLNGGVDSIKILSWSDEEYPSKEVVRLPKPQRDLAEARNKTIQNYVKELSAAHVSTYNMAVRPNGIQKILSTTSAKLKQSMVEAGLPTTADDPQYPSKASHAVILISLN